MIKTTTNDPIILDLVEQYKRAVKAWELAIAEEQRIYAEKPFSAVHHTALAKLNEALETVNTLQTALCSSFVYALEHSKEGVNS